MRKADAVLAERNRRYHLVFTSPDGKFILADLKKIFGGSTLRKVDGVIDPHASMAASGSREVVDYIFNSMRKDDAMD